MPCMVKSAHVLYYFNLNFLLHVVCMEALLTTTTQLLAQNQVRKPEGNMVLLTMRENFKLRKYINS